MMKKIDCIGCDSTCSILRHVFIIIRISIIKRIVFMCNGFLNLAMFIWSLKCKLNGKPLTELKLLSTFGTTLLRYICRQDQPWISMMQYFIWAWWIDAWENKDSSVVVAITQCMYSFKDSTFYMRTTVGKIMARCSIVF